MEFDPIRIIYYYWCCTFGAVMSRVFVVFLNINFSFNNNNNINNNNNTYQLKVHIGIIQRVLYFITILRCLSLFIWRDNLAVYECFF
jgi:hypothetical protein